MLTSLLPTNALSPSTRSNLPNCGTNSVRVDPSVFEITPNNEKVAPNRHGGADGFRPLGASLPSQLNDDGVIKLTGSRLHKVVLPLELLPAVITAWWCVVVVGIGAASQECRTTTSYWKREVLICC